jgi:tRNA-dihydrouridine synthase 2
MQHPNIRTRDERPRHPAHWDKLLEIRKIITAIPLIANGDVFTPQDIKRVKEMTNVDSVMIARGAILNCSIFQGELQPQIDVVRNYIRKVCSVANAAGCESPEYVCQYKIHSLADV